jgi:catechol 2,3-dioxygenase-like lactoylglutathione lyase family enzyme
VRSWDHPAVDQALEAIDRFTLPVRDTAKATIFYTDVMGGDLIDDRAVEIAGVHHPAARVRMCPAVDIVLVEQRYGWQPIDTPNPHWGFAIPAADVDPWIEHLEDWGVPSALVFREADVTDLGQPTRVELHFLDPDGNQIELICHDYPMNDRAWRGRYDAFALAYDYRGWPASR